MKPLQWIRHRRRRCKRVHKSQPLLTHIGHTDDHSKGLPTGASSSSSSAFSSNGRRQFALSSNSVALGQDSSCGTRGVSCAEGSSKTLVRDDSPSPRKEQNACVAKPDSTPRNYVTNGPAVSSWQSEESDKGWQRRSNKFPIVTRPVASTSLKNERPQSLHSDKTGSDTAQTLERVSVLGQGTFGQVYLARKHGGLDANRLYAEKVVQGGQAEGDTLRLFAGHPYIVQLRYSFSRHPQSTSLVLDYAQNGTLEGRSVSSDSRAMAAAAQLASAIASIHARDVVHRDVKPSNILIDDEGHMLLSDFGLSARLSPGQLFSGFCGSLEYAAPEILRRGVGYGKPVDWWALGCVVYALLRGGVPPFAAGTTRCLFDNILHAEPCATNDLVAGLLDKRPNHRFNAASWHEASWLIDFDFEAIMQRTCEPPFPSTIARQAPSSKAHFRRREV